MADRPYNAKDEKLLMTELWSPAIAENPYAFVMFAFPWGKEGTPLESRSGPRKWQKEELLAIAKHIQANKQRIADRKHPIPYNFAVSSGRGPGKSTFFAWITLWAMSCRLGGTVIVTANTESQLKSKTWAELGKWHGMMINSHWFDKQAMSLRPQKWFAELLKKQLKIDSTYYYAEAQTWSEENPDAFAGAHNPLGMIVIFDEASGIPEPIWTVTEGFFTEPELHRYWFAFSNPRRNTGAFFECFHRHRNRWKTRMIDSRTVEDMDLAVFRGIIEKYGDDSDEARIEVKGQFPKTGDNQFISRSVVQDAIDRETIKEDWAPLMMGVDPARFGDDSTVIFFRQGRNARLIKPIEMRGADNMTVANKCAELIDKFDPDAVCIDAGNGTGIIDRLREMGYKVHEVWFGSKSPEPEWANLRTYMWAKIREWLPGGCIWAGKDPAEPNDVVLLDDLVTPEYKFMGTSDKIRLETKEEMKKRGFASPNFGDALACTFAIRVANRKLKASRASRRKVEIADGVDYDVFG